MSDLRAAAQAVVNAWGPSGGPEWDWMNWRIDALRAALSQPAPPLDVDRLFSEAEAPTSLLALADEWCERTNPDDNGRLNVRGFAIWADLRRKAALAPIDVDRLAVAINTAQIMGPEWLGRDLRPAAAKVAKAYEEQRMSPLTRRQRQVMGLLVAGLTNKEIGLRLGITGETVKNHITGARHRLGLEGTNRVELAARVRERSR